MKKLTLLSLLIIALPAWAQQWRQVENTVPCGPFRDIVKVLTQEKYKEVPLWVGRSGQDPTSFTLFYNSDRGNFTLLQYYRETACILGMGDSSDIVNLAPFTQKQ